jgi:hypothetical protein
MRNRLQIIKESIRNILESMYDAAAVLHKPTGLVVKGVHHADAIDKLTQILAQRNIKYDSKHIVDGFTKAEEHGGGFFNRDNVEVETGRMGETYHLMAHGYIPFNHEAVKEIQTKDGKPIKSREELHSWLKGGLPHLQDRENT